MKTFKTILAWLDWSTYCRNSDDYFYNYEFPKSLCSLFWRTLLSLAALPFMYWGHLWNLITVKMSHFRSEDRPQHKTSIWVMFLVHFLWVILGTGAHTIIDDALGWNWYKMSDPLYISYFKVLLGGLALGVGILIALALIILVIAGAYMGLKKLFTAKPHDGPHSDIPFNDEPNWFVKIYRAIKDKYCPRMDWSLIRNKK